MPSHAVVPNSPILVRSICIASAVLALGLTSACAPRTAPAPLTDNGQGGGAVVSDTHGGGGTAPVGSALPGSAEDFRINVGDRVYFDLNSYQLRSDAMPRLNAQADWLQRYPTIVIRIEGNADERGTSEYNLALGARRAESVRMHLIGRGVAASRIETISFGKERPIVAGSTEAAFAQNRNAHTAIVSSR